MGRKRDPRRKEEMLGAVADYILENGLSDLSLRPLASGVGTNPRMLLYYFESREKLIIAAMNEVYRTYFPKDPPARFHARTNIVF